MINLFDEVKDTFWFALCSLGLHKWKECYSARGRTTYKCQRDGCDAQKYIVWEQ